LKSSYRIHVLLLVWISVLLLFLQMSVLPAFGEGKETNVSTKSGQKDQSVLTGVRTGEHDNFTRIVFEFRNEVRFKDPKINHEGKFSVLFLNSATDLSSSMVYETDSLQKVQSVEFTQNKSNLTANIRLTFPYFMLRAFPLDDPVRIVVDAYPLTALTKNSVPYSSLKDRVASKETLSQGPEQMVAVLEDSAADERSKLPEPKEMAPVWEDASTKEITKPPQTQEVVAVSEDSQADQGTQPLEPKEAKTAAGESSATEEPEQPETIELPGAPEDDPTQKAETPVSEPSDAQASEEMVDDGDTVTFPITSFEIINNTVLSSMEIKKTLAPFTGPKKTAEDVEKARNALERYYHKRGYPTALVNIPEQSVEDGIVGLEVIESTIRRVRVTGNRYFTMDSIHKKLPSFQPGEILFLPRVQEELTRINRNPDIKVAPVLMPGKQLGTIDVELKVKDKLPLHGSLELNNRASHDTTDLRLNGIMRYDNLWQKEHSVSFQYQVSPEDSDEVQAVAGSYVLPSPWNEDHMLAIYGVWSDSDIAFGEGFQSIGKGMIYGVRNVMPLPRVGNYNHSLSLGFDYKDYDDDLSFTGGTDAIETPITYLPFSFAYNSVLSDPQGSTKFNGGVNILFRGLVTDEKEFEDKRYKSRANYVYATLGVERYQLLPKGFQLFVKCDGQIADQPLPSNEQYFAGGLKSVRGYKETEESGDNALHGTLEVSYPKLAQYLGLPDWCSISPNIFYDIATLKIKDRLPGEDQADTLAGTGAGISGNLSHFFQYELSWGVALKETGRTEKGNQELYFIMKGQF
jgi:hemolysin activation/secretion protein